MNLHELSKANLQELAPGFHNYFEKNIGLFKT